MSKTHIKSWAQIEEILPDHRQYEFLAKGESALGVVSALIYPKSSKNPGIHLFFITAEEKKLRVFFRWNPNPRDSLGGYQIIKEKLSLDMHIKVESPLKGRHLLEIID